MFPVYGGRGGRALAVGLLLSAAQAAGQDIPPADPPPTIPVGDNGVPFDPEAPLAPLPELGIEWPDPGEAEDAAPGEPAIAETLPAETTPVEAEPATAPVASGSETAERRYSYAIEGIDAIDANRVRERFRSLSVLAEDEDETANSAQIERRTRQDEALLIELMRAEGYYNAGVTSRVEAAGEDRLLITFTVEPGQIYRFAEVELEGIEQAGDKAAGLNEAFGIDPGDPVDAERVLAGETALNETIRQQGFPFATVGEPMVVIDHATQTARLSMSVEPGEPRSFGAIRVADAEVMGAEHLQKEIARFQRGDPYDQREVDDLRQAIIQTGLVSSVRIEPVPGSTPGTVDLEVAMTPAPPRTIAGEVGYDTGEGFRIEASWTHRNYFKPEGAVSIRGIVGTREQLIGLGLRRNNFRSRDQVLTAGVSIANTRFEAFRARTVEINAGLERQTNIFFQKDWTWFFGAELLATSERDIVARSAGSDRRTFIIGAVPTGIAYDGTDDLLNPTNGFRLGARLSPEASFESGFFAYGRVQLDGSYYQPVSDTVVLAGRARLGTIIGSSATRIAPSRRFYAGGGASVRGYGFQRIGPRDLNNDPVGGRSLLEFSAEARIRTGLFGGNLGIVPFIDAGNIDSDALPNLNRLRVGAGLGVRYFTNFGPIRVDVGTPLNPQQGDPKVAVYVSLGQAF